MIRWPAGALLALAAAGLLATGAHGAPPGGARPAEPHGPLRVVLGSGAGSARAVAPAPVSFSLKVAAARVEVVPSEGPEVRVLLPEAPQVRVALIGTGSDRMEAEFDGRRRLQQGKLRLELPRRSRLEIASLEGRIAVRGVGGEVRVRAASGDVDLSGCQQVDAETIDGEIDLIDTAGSVAVRTVSGKISIESAQGSARVDAESSSGPIEFRGACGRGCRLDLETVGAPITLSLDPQSSFALSWVSHGGKVSDGLGLQRNEPREKSSPGWVGYSFGGSDGEIECETFSGDLRVQARK